MTLWELAACAAGVNKANGGEELVEAPSREEYENMMRQNADWIENGLRGRG